ncbi:ABC transporter substrate-binding protein [Paenibacillus herberti]|uniref:ABC transporter substrate-binding protein n=2 Tax=Paenibacillus herberti TaxID=1619309 RepID=A0A229NUF9_9BACL|nr:ABC transporter substrate-binding protein [Paenibacillus herberti]
MLLLGCALLLIVLTACGGGSDSTTNGANQTATTNSATNGSNQAANAGGATNAGEAGVSPSPSPAAESSEFKKIKTVSGEIEVPVNPKRIVAEEYLGSLIPLGVIPVGAPGLTLQNLYFKDALKGVADTGTYGKMNLEKIVELNPDLILSSSSDNYAQLSKIAPTVVVPYGNLKNAHEELTYFGELLGKQEEAEAWLKNYDARIAAAKERVDKAVPAGASFSILEIADKTIYTYGDNFGRGGQPIYQALGRKPPAKVAGVIMEKQWAELSQEMVAEYAGDYLIITSNSRTLEELNKDPLWSTLPAFKNGKVYVWKEERSWYYDPIAVLSQTEELANWLAPAN